MSTSSSAPNTGVTVAFVHGAFADSSGWNDVVAQLQRAGITAQAISNPLRGIAEDTAYVASALSQIPGRVLAVGHSYGGAIITNAVPRVVLGELAAASKDSVLNTALVELKYPTTDGGSATEFAINPLKFHGTFAADLSEKQAAVMAATQRPVAEAGFTERSGPPAWKNLPCWAVVATGDTAAGADIVRSMAERANANITEVKGSHVIMMSQPKAVADVIRNALSSLN